jgi:hypothetical protein
MHVLIIYLAFPSPKHISKQESTVLIVHIVIMKETSL